MVIYYKHHCQLDVLGSVDEPKSPVIGNNVDIGAGAKVLGRITRGDGVLIGANAAVLQVVPADLIAMGVPASIKPRAVRAGPVVETSAPCL